MNQTEFAKHIGRTQGHISHLKKEGRLVMQGQMIDVDASIKLLDETKDPGKFAVVERHEKEREQKQTGSDMDEAPSYQSVPFQHARAMRENYNALMAKIAYEQEISLLLVASEVKFAVADGDAIIRNRFEAMPDMLAPQLAAISDEQKIRAMLMDHVEHILGELSRTFHGFLTKNDRADD